MSEKVYFDQDGVSVSDTRFVVKGTTYPINSIASVKATESKPIPLSAITLILIGFGFLLAADPTYFIVAPVAMALGMFWIIRKAKVYSVILHTSSGESPRVLQSKDRDHVVSIVSALNNAIIDRG